MSDIIQEVEEEVRRERWMAFWKQWGPWLGAGFAALILGVAGWEGWRWYSGAQAAAGAEQYLRAQEKMAAGDESGAQQIFSQMSQGGPAAYRSAGLMERAAILEKNADLPGALKAFDEAAQVAESPALKASAALRAAMLAADVEDFPKVQARVRPLIDAGGPFSFLARELLAVEAIEAGQNALAETELKAIRDSLDAPPELQQRATAFLQAIAPTEPKAAAPASPAPAAPAKTPTTGEKQ